MQVSTLTDAPGGKRTLSQDVHFHKLDLGQQLAHTLDSPWVAYFLFVVGLLLIVFEFFTAGVGIAGFVGAVALVGGCFGFSHLPVAPWAVALIMFGIFGLAVDVQAGGLGVWTFIGGAALTAGSIWLYDGSSRLDPKWWVLVLVIGGTIAFMLSGMTAMVRARFSTPTIGRGELVGEMGARSPTSIRTAWCGCATPGAPGRTGRRRIRRRQRAGRLPSRDRARGRARAGRSATTATGTDQVVCGPVPRAIPCAFMVPGGTGRAWRSESLRKLGTSGRGRGPESTLFFPPAVPERREGEARAKAKHICTECSVRQECLAFALRVREAHGIWGGLTEVERRHLLTED